MDGAAHADGARMNAIVDFASRRAEQGKKRVWLTAFTATAALVLLAVIWMSLAYGG
jgi:hypothetical protein